MADERKLFEIEKLGREFVEKELKFSFTSMETKRMANLLLKSFLYGAKAQCDILIDKVAEKDKLEEEDTEDNEKMYRLEYNENQGNFHFAFFDAPTEHIHHHWVTICKKLKVEQCEEFVEYFDEELGYGKGEKHSLEIVKREFEKWLAN